MYEEEIAAKKAFDRDRENLKAPGGYADCGTQAAGQIGSLLTDDRILDELFKYHKPNSDQTIRYENLRAAAKAFAKAVCINVPKGSDQVLAITKIREAMMTANAGIALSGLSW